MRCAWVCARRADLIGLDHEIFWAQQAVREIKKQVEMLNDEIHRFLFELMVQLVKGKGHVVVELTCSKLRARQLAGASWLGVTFYGLGRPPNTQGSELLCG